MPVREQSSAKEPKPDVSGLDPAHLPRCEGNAPRVRGMVVLAPTQATATYNYNTMNPTDDSTGNGTIHSGAGVGCGSVHAAPATADTCSGDGRMPLSQPGGNPCGRERASPSTLTSNPSTLDQPPAGEAEHSTASTTIPRDVGGRPVGQPRPGANSRKPPQFPSTPPYGRRFQ